MKRFSVCGLALLMLVALVVTTVARADEDSKKLLNLNLPKISLKKSDCCADDKECCDEKEACCSNGLKVFSRAKNLFKKGECTGKEDCPVCNAKEEDSEDASEATDAPAEKLTGKATETAKNLTGKAGEVVKESAGKAKETIGKLRQRTEKMFEKIRK